MNLTKSFGGVRAVDGVTLEFSGGEVVGLIGPNGAGKTTLANIISGFLYPDSGHVFLNDLDIARLPAYKRARLGIIKTFQLPKFISELTVKEACLLPYLIYNGRIPKYNPQYFEALLQLTGFVHKRDLRLSQCSPTDLRLIQFIYSVTYQPKVLLADEPFVGLTVNDVIEFFNFIKNNVVKNDMIIIIIEHNLPVLTKLTDRIIVMNEGKILASGSPKEVLQIPEVIQTYFGYTK